MANDENQFNLAQFNHNFLLQYQAREKRRQKKEEETLAKLNRPPASPRLRDQTIAELAYGCKDTLFEVVDDLFQFRLPTSLWTQTSRLYHVGIIMMLSSIVLLFFHALRTQSGLRKEQTLHN